MNDSKNTVNVTVVKKSFWHTVSEMIGRVLEDRGILSSNSFTWSLYTSDNSIDYAKVNYWLTRAIFYASEVRDPVGGGTYGKKFLLGAGFGKPIINSSAAFSLGKLPEVVSDEDSDMAESINHWIDSMKSNLFAWGRNGFRDGDSYIRIHKDGKLSIIAPHKVDKIVDPVTGELQGYDITHYVKNREKNKLTKYVEELRTTAPFRRVMIYEKDKSTPTVQEGSEDVDDFGSEIRPLPIIHFANEREADQIYGNSDYQNIYIDMMNYHSILENAVKNNIYNSNAIPILTGIDNPEKFMETNGIKMSDGSYNMKWDAKKLLLGGKDFDVKVVGGVANASDADKLLNIFFWKIAQGSETPEFVFGTAVSSSKASVQEQMPVAIMKGQRKQTQLSQPFTELVRNWLWYGEKFRFPDFENLKSDLQFELKWLSIVDDDMNLNIEIVNALSEQGCITDKTKMMILNMGKYVTNFDEEIENARQEQIKKQELSDPFATSREGNADLDEDLGDIPAE